MNPHPDGARGVATHERPTGELVQHLSEQVSTLVREELKLAQLEMTRKGKKAGLGAGMLGGAALIAVFAVACLIACAVIAIAGVISAWLAALIIGAALLAAAGIAAFVGLKSLRKATPPVPKDTVNSVKTDVEVVRQRVRHGA
jgi:uncharacterized membrane protein YqjE